MQKVFLVGVAFAIAGIASGCVHDGVSPEVMANYQRELAACSELKGTAVAQAKCVNYVVDRYVQTNVNRDLLSLEEADRLALSEQIDAGKLTRAQADLQFAQMRTQLTSEAERRANNSAIATAAMMSSMPQTCNSYGNGAGVTTNCF